MIDGSYLWLSNPPLLFLLFLRPPPLPLIFVLPPPSHIPENVKMINNV